MTVEDMLSQAVLAELEELDEAREEVMAEPVHVEQVASFVEILSMYLYALRD